MDSGSQAMHCHEASWAWLLANASFHVIARSAFATKQSRFSSAVKDEIASSLCSSQ